MASLDEEKVSKAESSTTETIKGIVDDSTHEITSTKPSCHNGVNDEHVNSESLGTNAHDKEPSTSTTSDHQPPLTQVKLRKGSESNILDSPEWKSRDNHIFILSSAGKPVYSRNGCEDDLVTLFGVMQALVSFVQDSSDTIKSIRTPDKIISFLIKGPIIVVSVFKLEQHETFLFKQLNYVYNEIVSILSLTQITTIFEKRNNYDLRRLLSGSERLFDNLLKFTEECPDFLLDSVSCLQLPLSFRDSISSIVVSACSKVKNLVFAILIANNKLITLVRLKKYEIKPSDLHLIINLVGCSESFKTAESWMPICLPDFDSSGFLHAHVSYLDNCPACLLLLTVEPNIFFTLSEAKQKIVDKFTENNILLKLTEYISKPEVRMQDLRIDTVKHFLYKCNKTNNIFYPALNKSCFKIETINSLLIEYKNVIYERRKGRHNVKLIYKQLAEDIILGWMTDKFELFAVFDPFIAKDEAVEVINKIYQWILKNEDELFLKNIQTF